MSAKPWSRYELVYDPYADVRKVGAWHFFIPLPDSIPQRDGRCYVGRPSGLSEGERGPMFTPDSVCIVTHSVMEKVFPDAELEAVQSVLSKRCNMQMIENESPQSLLKNVTVAEILVSKQLADKLVGPDALQEQITIAFEFALSRLNQWLGAVSLAIRQPLTKVRREALPHQIPFGEGPLEPWELETRVPGRVQIAGEFVVNSNFPDIGHPSELPVEFDQWIDAALLNLDVPGPFVRAQELQSQAEIYRKMTGDYKVAIILFATACESLVDDLLQHLYWESNLSPHEAAENFLIRRKKGFVQPKTIKTLVTTDLYQLLTGLSWRGQKDPAVESWLSRVVSVRNDIVHNAKEPDYVDMVDCEEGLESFYGFLKDAVFSVREEFPLTALAFLGEGDLSFRGDWERFRTIEQSLEQVRDRMARFRRWSYHLAVLRKDPAIYGSKADAEDGLAQVVFENGVAGKAYVVHENGTVCLELPLEQAAKFEPFKKILESPVLSDEFTLAKYHEKGGFQLPAGARWNLYVYDAIRPLPMEAPRLRFE